MTNQEFQIKLEEMWNKYPLLKLSNPKSMNELVYVLRMEGDVDYSISDNCGGCIPSVRETFIPSSVLARKVTNIKYEEYIDGDYISHVILVDLK